MLYNLYEYLHHTLGMHLWDLPALLVAIVTAAVLIVHSRNQKKREDDFNEELQKKLEQMNKETVESVQA